MTRQAVRWHVQLALTVLFVAMLHAPGSHAQSPTTTTEAAPVSAVPPGVVLAGPPTGELRATTTAQMLDAMAMLTGTPATRNHIQDWAHRLDGGAPLDNYIDELLTTPRFANEIVPTLVFGSFANVRNYYALPSGFVLKETREDGEPILYLRAPCHLADAVAVHPWWNLEATVKVCPDTYRPDKWILTTAEHSYRSRMPLSCDSQVGSPELESRPLCGCGPNLVRCLRDDEQYNEFNRSLLDEVRGTTGYVVDHDLPFASLFTGNSTFRDRNTEIYYRRQRIGALHDSHVDAALADIAMWPETGKWAARDELVPGEHAGLLTAPQILHSLPDRRQRQRGYYEIMWCAMRNSFGATTQKVLELNTTGNLAFVHDSWQRLAHTELCMNCHARLDYGFQFFMGYPDSRASTHFEPDLVIHDRGPLYGRDIRDPRGEGPLTPLEFAQLATAQPEFTGCMAKHFVNYVLGSRATLADREAITDAAEHTGRFKAVMKVALERFAEHWRAQTPPVVASASSPVSGAAAAPGMVAIGPELRARLEHYCSDCHDREQGPFRDDVDNEDVRPYDFTPAQLPRALVVRMADKVAFGMMPKDNPLDDEPREQLVTGLIDSLWTDPSARSEAARYYLGQARGLPAQQIDNTLFSIEQLAHARSGIAWGAIERGLWPDQATITPGFLALTGLDALAACLQAHRDGAGLEDCLSQTTTLRTLSRWPFDVP